MSSTNIRNPGSALGEAVGVYLERNLHTLTNSLCDKLGYHYISESPIPNKKKLLLYDNIGIPYNIDGVITNQGLQPIILLEYKYIRYKKHNRDKGSWLCTAHPQLRNRYETVRSSIAVLGGSWSKSSITMIKSHDINIFMIPFDYICERFSKVGIDFNWDEKDRDTAIKSWKTWISLEEKVRESFGQSLLKPIIKDYTSCLKKILACSDEREIEKIFIQLITNLGERKGYYFDSIKSAIEFLSDLNPNEIINLDEAITLLDTPPVF